MQYGDDYYSLMFIVMFLKKEKETETNYCIFDLIITFCFEFSL